MYMILLSQFYRTKLCLIKTLKPISPKLLSLLLILALYRGQLIAHD